jgi:coenzyme PQQ precursor peptide PqqA
MAARSKVGRSHGIIALGGASLGRCFFAEDLIMKWETPTAVDFRFGMEITMYVSNR